MWDELSLQNWRKCLLESFSCNDPISLWNSMAELHVLVRLSSWRKVLTSLDFWYHKFNFGRLHKQNWGLVKIEWTFNFFYLLIKLLSTRKLDLNPWDCESSSFKIAQNFPATAKNIKNKKAERIWIFQWNRGLNYCD